MQAAVPSKYRRMRLLQEEKQWDIDTDIPWASLDPTKPLLPRVPAFTAALGLTADEELAFSQVLGLMAVQAISEHEKVLGAVKERCWTKPLSGVGTPDDVAHLGEQFFREEAKHAEAFGRYVAGYAAALGVELADLKSILPTYDRDSLTTRLFALNSALGGRAMWWLVMITEEESLALFRRLRDAEGDVDPLFYELNRQHFDEEIRHMSYAPLMLRHLSSGAWPFQRYIMQFDYLTAEVLHVAWLLKQMTRLKRVHLLRAKHPAFARLSDVMRKFEALSWTHRLGMILGGIPYASEALNPRRHRAVGIEIKRNGEVAPDCVQRLQGWLRSRLGPA